MFAHLINDKTNIFLYYLQLPTTENAWLAYEQAWFMKYGVSHVLLVMDVYEAPVASRNIYFKTAKGDYRIKFLFIMAPTGEIVHCSGHPGCLDNQAILARSSFGRMLRNSANPLNIPQRLRFRDSGDYATPCILADKDWSAGGFPYLLISPGTNQMNHCRLSIERFFGRFVNVFRCLLEYVLVENGHMLCDMVYTAVAIYNHRLKMTYDPAHVHTIVCVHCVESFFDATRIVRHGPVYSPADNREKIMQYHGVVQPENHRMWNFPEPGGIGGMFAEDEMDQVRANAFDRQESYMDID